MRPFDYIAGATAEEATRAVALDPAGIFYAGGTTLIDLMKLDVMTPDKLVDVRGLPYDAVEVDGSGIHIGANVSNSRLAAHPEIRTRYKAISEALLSGASPQLRNMATTAGNILQRTRCPYFRSAAARCNKREPGTGCDALAGDHSSHAILGGSDLCIATHPSDFCVPLAAFGAEVRTRNAEGAVRSIPFRDFHVPYGDEPDKESVLEHGELITHIDLPDLPMAANSHYVKVRERASYAFALASAAVALQVENGEIVDARVALGGLATKPWHSPEAEAALRGKPANRETFQAAAEAALAGAAPRKHNAYKVELGKRTLVLALRETLQRMK